MGITGRIYSWIENFLSARTIQVRVGASLSQTKSVDMGTPQGSVLSPLLFLLMVAEFPEDKRSLIETSLLADDSAIWKSGRYTAHIWKCLQAHLDVIHRWCTT